MAAVSAVYSRPGKASRGAAIISALLVVALAAALAAGLSVRVSRWLDGLRQEREDAQTSQMVRAALDWTRSVLEQDAATSATDHLGEAWAQPSPIIPIEQEGELRGRIEDASARFNLNNLVTEQGTVDLAWLAAYRRLLRDRGLPAELATVLANWLDRDGTLQAGGGTENWGEDVRPANAPLSQAAEIAAIPGYSPDVAARLLPFVTALPARTVVNANTASRELLAALADDGSASLGPFLAERDILPYRDKADLLSRLERSRLRVNPDLLGVSSDWFLVSGHIRYRQSEQVLEALLAREHGRTRIVWWARR
jgi:general secretion pathway protein K